MTPFMACFLFVLIPEQREKGESESYYNFQFFEVEQLLKSSKVLKSSIPELNWRLLILFKINVILIF
ncbi:unnamed protein product [Rhizophagus irregularis]|uniref:Uncharacterized protein n=1 Tax=Rhizophagus irregularis TaxID=588596 RepID=A0A915ZMW3_9GLOM|nr:unnamed protein product [Rhizophagus irregularis]